MGHRANLSVLSGLVLATGPTACGADPVGSPLSVMSFNVLCAFCGGTDYDPYEERLLHFRDLWQRHDPDLVGLQELSFRSDRDLLLTYITGYSAISFEQDGELYADATLLYRTARFDELEHGFYWLSPTPDEPYSTGFAAGMQLPRLVTWAILTDKATGQRLFFATTHFDNNAPSQEKSAPLVLERSQPFADQDPVILVGDFNSQPTDPAYRRLTGLNGGDFYFQSAYDRAQELSLDTNQEAPLDFDPQGRIDHIFTAGTAAAFPVTNFAIDHHVYGALRRYPSDHRAVNARFSLPATRD